MGYIPRKADREAMAARAMDFASTHGLTFERHDLCEREISIELGSGPYRVLFHVVGDCAFKGTGWMGHWYTECGTDALYPPSFPNVNTITRRKATTFAATAGQFFDSLAIGFEAVADQGA